MGVVNMTRVCCRCKIEKPLEEFTKNRNMKYGYDTICLICNRIRANKWDNENPGKNAKRHREWYKKNREYVKEVTINHQKEIRNFIEKYKENKSCSICGYNKWGKALHLHHKDRNTKKFGIANATNLGVSIETLKEEIDKCIILCSNCHTELHYLENKKQKEISKKIEEEADKKRILIRKRK
jgi:hypothetical protein